MDNSKDYFKGKIKGDDFIDHQRDQFKKRHEFEETTMYKMTSLCIKVAKQVIKNEADADGQPLNAEEIELAKQFLIMAEKEIERNRVAYQEEQE